MPGLASRPQDTEILVADEIWVDTDIAAGRTSKRALVGDAIRKATDKRASTQNGVDHAWLIAPSADTTQGVVFKRPSATAGDATNENAWIVVDESATAVPGSTAARCNWRGEIGAMFGHFAPNAGGPQHSINQAVWADLTSSVNLAAAGVQITAHASGTGNAIGYTRPGGNNAFQVKADGHALTIADDGSTSVGWLAARDAGLIGVRLFVRALSAATIVAVVRGEATQTGDLMRWDLGAAAIKSRIEKGGRFATRVTSAPADGDVATSECVFWFDDSAGAAKVMFKAKDSGGTVRTGQVALS